MTEITSNIKRLSWIEKMAIDREKKITKLEKQFKMEQLENEKLGLEQLKKLPSDTGFKYYYGSWAFTTEEGNLAESYLTKAGTKKAILALGKLYKKIAISSEKYGSSEYISSAGRGKSEEYLGYWAIRSYLIVNEEEKAIQALDKFGKYPSIILTLKRSVKEATSNLEEKLDPGRNFNLPYPSKYPNFYEKLKQMTY